MMESNKFSKNYNYQEEKLYKPKILMVGPIPPPTGGIQTVVHGLLNSNRLASKYRIIHVNNGTSRPRDKKGRVDLLNLLSFAKQSCSVLFAIIRYKPDVVHIHTAGKISFLKNSIFILLARITERKILLSIHAAEEKFFISSHNLFVNRYLKFILRNCKFIHVLSPQWALLFKAHLGIPEGRLFIIPNVVNEEDLAVLQKKNPERSDEKPIKIISVGILGFRKGTFDIIRSIGLLKQKGFICQVLLVGPFKSMDVRKKLYSLCEEQNVVDNVNIVGEKDHSEALRLLTSCNIFVLPSYAEGLPVSLLEAMAAGLPVVTTPVGGIPEIVKDGENGFLVNPGDIQGLSKAVELLLLNRVLREKMGSKNKEIIVKGYSSYIQAEKFDKVYRKML